MNININIFIGIREIEACVLVLKWIISQLFDDDKWNMLFKCHVDDNGEWCECTIYALKLSSEPGSHVCLCFGDEKYEGLRPNWVRMINCVTWRIMKYRLGIICSYVLYIDIAQYLFSVDKCFKISIFMILFF